MEQTPEDITHLTEGYTAGQAAKIMTRNSHRPVSPDYIRKLAQKGMIRAIHINVRLSLYNKEDVDGYIVEERGKKAGRAAHHRAQSQQAA